MRGGRWAGRAGEHLVDPDAKPVGADRSDREDGHHDRGQEQESENLHALTAHARSRVVGGRHIRSRLKCGDWDGIRAVALLHFRCIRAAAALIWINLSYGPGLRRDHLREAWSFSRLAELLLRRQLGLTH